MCTYLAILRIRAKVFFLLDTYDSHQIHPYLLTILQVSYQDIKTSNSFFSPFINIKKHVYLWRY